LVAMKIVTTAQTKGDVAMSYFPSFLLQNKQ